MAKLLEAMYENKLEFPGGWGAAKQKKLLWGGGGGEYRYFLELLINLKIHASIYINLYTVTLISPSDFLM